MVQKVATADLDTLRADFQAQLRAAVAAIVNELTPQPLPGSAQTREDAQLSARNRVWTALGLPTEALPVPESVRVEEERARNQAAYSPEDRMRDEARAETQARRRARYKRLLDSCNGDEAKAQALFYAGEAEDARILGVEPPERLPEHQPAESSEPLQ